ncbi:MAG: MBOAT family protein [Lachnospiraceae bacterium]|nr:MBOAT family protein [Lachnospiraceae bacterium]
MLFNSVNFLIFLPVTVLVYYLLPAKYRCVWLLAASYFFYAQWNSKYTLLLLSCTLITYVTAIWLDKLDDLKKRRAALAVCLTLVLGVLFFFKYTSMFFGYVDAFRAKFLGSTDLLFPYDKIILPVGISFFTLQSMGYVIDVYRKDLPAEKSFIKYALFVAFFPQLVAGPIERTKGLLAQLSDVNRKFKYEYLQHGVFFILYGLMIKMVIADNVAKIVDTVYADPVKYSGWFIVFAMFLFLVQGYGDFFGYSIIAKGSAALLGIKLMDNFDAPLYARSTTEYWRRWHISMCSWFRDYVYIPLGGSRRGKLRKYINIMIVFLLSGLWHGAAMSYVIWGGMNGVFQIVEAVWPFHFKQSASKAVTFITDLVKNIAAMTVVCFSLIFMRSGSFGVGLVMIKQMFSNLGNFMEFITAKSYDTYGITRAGMRGMFFGFLVLMVVDRIKFHGKKPLDILLAQKIWVRYAVYFAFVFFILIFGCYGEAGDAQQFIYFQF